MQTHPSRRVVGLGRIRSAQVDNPRWAGGMARSAATLLTQIEEGALDSGSALADVLRKCVALGGRAGSEELRDWARRELDGYVGQDELPPYRLVPAIIAIDGANLRWRVSGQEVSPMQLPEFVRDTIKQQAPIAQGVAELERLSLEADGWVRIQHPAMPDLVHYMNSEADYGSAIHSMYWKVPASSIHGVVDAVRTSLVALVAEMRALGVEDTPSAEAASQAFNVVLHNAKRGTINLNNVQAANSTMNGVRQSATRFGELQSSRIPAWIRGPWGFVVGAAGIAAAVAAVAVWIGWNPFA